MRLIALERLIADYFGIQQLPHLSHVNRVKEVDLQKGLSLSVVTIEVKLVLELGFVYDWFVYSKGLLINGLEFNQEVKQEYFLLEGLLELVSFDVEEGEEAMDVTAAFLIVLVGSVYSDNRGNLYGLCFEVEFVMVDGEAFIEGGLFGWREFK